ncbi:type IV secretory system conjugative DNA transfer family protein [Rickettsiales bacterium]|nr:type IV secretory system conjugative DNA transfer family protein [Rickettsiales bacterium]
MSDDTPELVRHLRNFTIITLLFIVTFFICGYVTVLLVAVTMAPTWKIAISYFAFPNWDHIITLWNVLIQYWIFYLKNLDYLDWNSAVPTATSYISFFVTKLYSTTFIPYLVLFILLWRLRAPLMDWRPFKKAESIHGNAKWANDRDISKMGLKAKSGVLLGEYRGKFLIANDYQHILLFAPTGSGKGVGFVIPNLLFWQDSVIVHDIKLENYELTSGYRKNKLNQKTFLWNPADPDGISHCYNPMDWISKKSGKMVDDVQKIANFLLPEQEFWQNEGRSLLVGVMLYLLADNSKPSTLGEVVRTLRNDDVVYNLAVILDTMGKDIHPVSYMNIAAYLQKPDKERGSVTSTANSSLELWANPLIDKTTATSDFNLNHFKKEPHTLYIGLTPDNISRLKPLMGIFYQQAASFFTARMPRPEEKTGVLMMMDEFPTLGKLEQFQAGIAYFRGYRVKLFLIIQDTQQLKGIYEEAGMNSFLSNSTYRITFAANNMETANLISQLIGNKTATQVSSNKPKYLDLNPGSRNLHISHTQRALLLPQEVIQLPRDDQIILIESQPPIKSKKIKYYADKFFKKRLLPQIDIPKQEPYIPVRPEKRKPSQEEEQQNQEKIE